MDKIHFSNFRAFKGSHEFGLSPITLITGENSTGKSTLLALIRIAWDTIYNSEVSFNEEPFNMGSYDDIAHYHGGQGARASEFYIGATIKHGRDNAKVTSYFTKRNAHPFLYKIEISLKHSTFSFSLNSGKINVEIFDVHRKLNWSAITERGYINSRGFVGSESPLAFSFDVRFAILNLSSSISAEEPPQLDPSDLPENISKDLKLLNKIARGFGYRERRPISMAPMRTKPERTYDPRPPEKHSGGDHVPQIMNQLASQKGASWLNLQTSLKKFGKQSGMFKDVSVKRFGNNMSNPFQIRVSLEGQKKNNSIVDVGYGVSQVLPIISEIVLSEEGTSFTIQQPEVHLHPKAQAQLGTFFIESANSKNRLYIETHSDQIIDRIRIEIRNKKFDSQKVNLIFVENANGLSVIHQITIDEVGNIEGAPSCYRDFFLKEELNLLGLS